MFHYKFLFNLQIQNGRLPFFLIMRLRLPEFTQVIRLRLGRQRPQTQNRIRHSAMDIGQHIQHFAPRARQCVDTSGVRETPTGRQTEQVVDGDQGAQEGYRINQTGFASHCFVH